MSIAQYVACMMRSEMQGDKRILIPEFGYAAFGPHFLKASGV